MAIINIEQEGAFSYKQIELDTRDIESYSLSVTLLGNYKLVLTLKSGRKITVKSSYAEDIQNLLLSEKKIYGWNSQKII